MNDRILTVKQMVFCEHRSDEMGVSLAALMDTAGKKLAEHILKKITKQCRNVVILLGKGNNGGDGLVAANILVENNIIPSIILCCSTPSTDLSKKAYERLSDKIPIYEYSDDDKIKNMILNADVLVDCIFGTGFKGEIKADMHSLFSACNNSNGYIISCDIPSGANAESGQAGNYTIKADLTVTFHAKKIGMLLSPAKYFCGKIVTEDIGIPHEIYSIDSEELSDMIYSGYDKDYFKALLPERKKWGHKGTFGKLISVCGSENYIGAAGISTLSALRTGVGLVDLCTPRSVINSLSSRILECTYSEMKTDPDGFITSENANKILEKLSSAQCLLLGCGLGHTDETEKLVMRLIENSPCPIVLDADGINSLCPNIDILLKKKSSVIITPHPAELARLCNVSTADVLSDRQKYASQLAKKYRITVVSKGAETLLCSGDLTRIIDVGNTALSKGGSGDMLAGIIASFVAQRYDCDQCNAWLGCYIMGKTAEMISETKSQRSIIASDIIESLPVFMKKLETETL